MTDIGKMLFSYTKILIAVITFTMICACSSFPATSRNSTGESVDTPGTIYSSLPESVNPDRHYLFYIHGAIIEDQGINANSPEYGRYEFPETLTYLANAGFDVIGEVRGPTPDPNLYAEQIIESIQYLKTQGIESNQITIMGFSKGAALTILTSSKLDDPDINYILIAICGEWLDQKLRLSGRVLSVYESSDTLGYSCKQMADRSPGISSFHEIEFNTGKKHGAFYTADPLWLDQVINWLYDNEK